jgi:chitosanase
MALSPDSIYNTTFEEMAYEITSTAENSTKDWTGVYGYIEDIADGRGYTAGLVGFTTANGDLLDVILAYNALSPGNPLSGYVSKLTTLKNEGEGSSAGSRANTLLGTTFKTQWTSLAGSDPALRQAQRQIREQQYWLPAFQQAVRDGVQGLGLAILYDISVNHGPGDDPQSFGGIVATARAASPPPSAGGSETAYLTALKNARSAVLTAWGDNPADGRVAAHTALIATGNLTLTAPISWSMYGDPYTISTRPQLPTEARRPNDLEPGAPGDDGTGGGTPTDGGTGTGAGTGGTPTPVPTVARTLAVGPLRAPVLRDALFATGFLTSDAVLSSSVAPIEAPGLAVPLEPRSFYAIDGYLAVTAANFTKLALDVPPGAQGHWGLRGVDMLPGTAAVGDLNGAYTGFGITHFIAISGAAGPTAVLVRGYVATVPGGALRLLFAQFASDPSQTSIRAGSWLRTSKLT